MEVSPSIPVASCRSSRRRQRSPAPVLEDWRDARSSCQSCLETPGGSSTPFRDVVALRTFVFLRESVSFQFVRKAVEHLHEFGNTEHL